MDRLRALDPEAVINHLTAIDPPPLYPTLAVGAATAVAWYTISRWQQRKRYPPGPYPLPIIGNVLTFSQDKKMWIILDELSRKHGEVFTIFFGNVPTVVLGNLDMVREAFLTKQNDFAGRTLPYTLEFITKGGKDILGGQLGPVWKKQRKIAHAAMRKFATGECLEKLIHQSLEKLFGKLDKKAGSGEAFDPQDNLQFAIHNIIFSMVFGKAFEFDDPMLLGYANLVDEMNEGLSSGLLADFVPAFRYIPTPGRNLLHRGMRQFFKLIDDIYVEHKKKFNESAPKDMVDFMLQTIKEVEKEEGLEGTAGLTEDHYQMIIFDIFSAGTDTSTDTLKWVVLYLIAYPECQKKMQEEIDSVLGKDENILLEHRPYLAYAEAFLHEVMRIRPIAPLAVPHETMCDTSVGGYPIPKGTMVIPNIWAIHMDKEAWGDPEVFRPERFLKEDGSLGPRISSWLPFSTGRRVCVGEAVAKAELHIFLASIVQRYNFRATDGVEIDLNPPNKGLKVVPNPYKVLISKR